VFIIPLQNRMVVFAVFCQIGPPRQVDCWLMYVWLFYLRPLVQPWDMAHLLNLYGVSPRSQSHPPEPEAELHKYGSTDSIANYSLNLQQV